MSLNKDKFVAGTPEVSYSLKLFQDTVTEPTNMNYPRTTSLCSIMLQLLSKVSHFIVLLTHGQLQSENMEWRPSEINKPHSLSCECFR